METKEAAKVDIVVELFDDGTYKIVKNRFDIPFSHSVLTVYGKAAFRTELQALVIAELAALAESEHIAMSCYWPDDNPDAIFCYAHARIQELSQ